MGDRLKWGIALINNYGSFLIGANINTGKQNGKWYGYLCTYLGFRTLVIGRDVFPEKGGEL